MPTTAQLYQDALNISTDAQSRLQNGAPAEKQVLIDLCAAVQMIANAGLNVTTTPVVLDTADQVTQTPATVSEVTS